MSTSGEIIRLVTGARAGDQVSLEQQSDDALMLMARGGSRSAFDTLVRRHQRRALAVAAKYLGSTALAADAAQDAFVEIYRARERYQARGRFSSYLYRVLLNQCRMATRSRRYEDRAREVLADEEKPARDPAPDASILDRERRRQVERAVGGLSDKLRAVVVLRYGGDMSYGEIAEVLDIPVGTVKRRLFDGVKKLSTMMEAVP